MASRRNPSTQLPIPFVAGNSCRREDFVPGIANEAGLALIEAWPHWPARTCALWGEPGSGKTHLAQIWRQLSGACELDAASLTAETLAGLQPGGAFLIDGADRVPGGAGLFHLVNFVNQTGGWLLMTGEEAPPRWPTTVPDLHSRLTAIPGAALESPDEALMARVLLKLFADRQVKPPEALIDYLVPRLRRSFSDAAQIVVLIDRIALQEKRRVSVDIAAQALRELEAGQGGLSADNADGLG